MILTKSHKEFDFRNPREQDIILGDIAHALSHQCRYAGHCARFYSVAEHSVHVARHVWDKYQDVELTRAALMHDAAEAYITDIPSSLKELLPDFQEVEERVERAIASKFGLDYPWDPRIMEVDSEIVGNEMDVLFGVARASRLSISINPMIPPFAEQAFLNEARIYGVF